MELLKELYKIHSPSGREKRLRRFITNHIRQNIPHATIMSDKIGNLYITKGCSKTYPAIVAHLDQVQRIHSKDFNAIETEDIIFGYSATNRRQEGLGADDKNGIWVALKCLERCDTLKVALFVQEEVGCVGSRAADIKFFDDCRFVIGVDRKGHNDLITNISWANLCSDDFVRDTDPARFGYKEECGFITDVAELKEQGLPISCINISCGYYEAHTDYEFTVKKDLLNCLEFVLHIVEKCTEVYPHIEYDPFDYDQTLFEGRDSVAYDELTYLARELLKNDSELTVDDLFDMYSDYYNVDKSMFQRVFEECKQSKQQL